MSTSWAISTKSMVGGTSYGRSAAHSLPQLLGEEALGCNLRVPDVEVRRPVVRLVEREELEAKTGYALERAVGVLGHRDHACAIEVAAVFECDVDPRSPGPSAR